MNWAMQHLRLRLGPIHRTLRAAVERKVSIGLRADDPKQTSLRLARLDQMISSGRTLAMHFELSDEGLAEEVRIREGAARDRVSLPIDRLIAELDLSPFEIDTVLTCAAVELDSEYGRVLAQIHEDSSRRCMSIELAASLTATTLVQRVARRGQLGRLGKLRRYGLVRASDAGVELEADIALTSPALHALLGISSETFHDPCEVVGASSPGSIAGLDDVLARRPSILGVWGRTTHERERVAIAIARKLRRALRRPWDRMTVPSEPARALALAARDATTLDAVLWIVADQPGVDDGVLDLALEDSRGLVILTAQAPRHPVGLVTKGFGEVVLPAQTLEMRRGRWRAAAPDLDDKEVDLLASRYRFDDQTISAAVALASASDRVDVPQAAAVLAQPQSLRFAEVIAPRRTFDDLILPPIEERQVRELAETYLAWPRVAEQWGFATASSVGVKALFTGEPGTGKTLAAEVIAGHLGLSLVRIDLARIVSKWVGETEKNLDAAFAEAEQSSAVLFFDEAEALFGKRGEVQHGTDRYANLEVSFLLQRLERHDGLVILASNLRDEIDPAFVRRFQHVVNFPRPVERERRRLWRLAFPAAAPLAPDLDLSVLARLDLTGAGIVSSARVAALAAARVGASAIGIPHVIEAVTSQFQREARALTATDLGPYAGALRTMRAS
jgi:AAA+ superfamily predicted ATPase